MKKKYTSPTTICVKLAARDGVMDVWSKVEIQSKETTTEQLVKGNRSTPSYNVWDDDWSN